MLAISVLAAGYFKPSEALDYIVGLENLKGAVVGYLQNSKHVCFRSSRHDSKTGEYRHIIRTLLKETTKSFE